LLTFCQAFEHCAFRGWNLSYACITGAAARVKLRELNQTDPVFWKELTIQKFDDNVPSENIPQLEDDIVVDEDIGIDDSDVPLKVLVQELADKPKMTSGYIVSEEGGFISSALAEQFEDEVETEVVDKKLGRGKRRKQANRLYSAKNFWMHGDENSDEDI
jgi:hypothetical protein